MESNPLVSIIIPTYNRAYLIGETLESIIAQTYQNWECIVVDDGSTDDTDEVMANYMAKDSRFRYYHRPKDRLPGGNAARNYGFEISKGEFIQWFDSDDIMLSEFLKKKINEFTPETHFVICAGRYVDENLDHIEIVEYFESVKLFKDYVLWNIKVFTPSVIFRRGFLEDQALFDLSILRGQETEFFSRVFFQVEAQNYKIINEPLFLYRQHNNTKSIRNKEYREAYNWSKSYISIENLNRGFLIEDKDIINHCFSRLINLFFKSIYNEDKKTAKFIKIKLSQILKKSIPTFAVELMVFGSYLMNFKKGRHFFYQRWKKIIIKRLYF